MYEFKITYNQSPFLILSYKQEDMGLPNPQRVVVLPDIEWEKYLGAAEAIEMAGFRHQTRGAKSSGSKHSASSTTAAAGPSSTSRKYCGNYLLVKTFIDLFHHFPSWHTPNGWLIQSESKTYIEFLTIK